MTVNNYTQQFFDAPNTDGTPGTHKLGYLEWGNDDLPPLVCVHGLTRNAHDFDYIADALSANFHVYCLDVTGRGSSEWLDNKLAYNYATYVADAIAFLQHIGHKKVHWLGTSMGGIIGMMLSAADPTLLASIVLNDIGYIVPKAGMERITSYAGAQRVFDSRKKIESYLADITEPFGIVEAEHWQHFVEHSIWKLADGEYILACDPEIMQPFREETDDFTHIVDIDLSPFWDAVACPVLLIRGEHSDLLTKEIAGKMASTKGKDITLIEFSGVGHAPALMDMEQITKVKSWLLWHR